MALEERSREAEAHCEEKTAELQSVLQARPHSVSSHQRRQLEMHDLQGPKRRTLCLDA